MTSRELTSVVISAWPWCIFPYNLMQDIFIQSKVIDIFPKFNMAAAAILDFQFMWIWPFRRVGSVVSVFCTKFGSNLCYSHWDRHTYFRPSFDDVTRINFRFRLSVMWSSPRRRGASSHILWCKISLSSPKLLTFFRNSRWRPPPSWIFSLCEFGHSGVLIVWHLCSVPNLVQISVIVTEIDAHMLQTFIWWRHAN